MKKILLVFIMGLAIVLVSCQSDNDETLDLNMCHTHDTCITIYENKVEATCKTPESYDKVVYCRECDYELSREKVTSEEFGAHSYIDGICIVCNTKESVFSGNLEYTLNPDNKSYTVTGMGNYEGSILIIPDEYNGLPVVKIGKSAFSGRRSITTLIIGNNVTEIEEYAFMSAGLVSVTVGRNLQTTGPNAFSYNSKLIEVINYSSLDIKTYHYGYGYEGHGLEDAKKVHTGESIIKNVDGFLFYTDNGINYLMGYIGSEKNLVLPDDYNGEMYLLYNGVFRGLGITSVTIPKSIIEISSYAFSGCLSLVNVNISDSVISIKSEAFLGCTNLTSLVIPESVTSIESDAFSSCKKLVEIINYSSLEFTKGSYDHGSVAKYAKKIHRGDSEIVNQDDYLFYTCDETNYLLGYVGNNTQLDLPASYNGKDYEIYSYAFNENSMVTSVSIPQNVKHINEHAFYNCVNLINCSMEEGITHIHEYAFYGSGLTSISIPASIVYIGYDAFECDSLTSVTFIDPDNWWYVWNKNSSNGTDLPAAYLSNSSIAAEYISKKYCDQYWKKG